MTELPGPFTTYQRWNMSDFSTVCLCLTIITCTLLLVRESRRWFRRIYPAQYEFARTVPRRVV